MITQRVVWTILPNGLAQNSNRVKASVLVSPRLSLPNTVAPSDLTQFPIWLDWPDIIRNTSYQVLTSTGETLTADLVSAPDSDTWRAIFPANTFVKPWVFDEEGLREKIILSYPVAGVANLVETIYGEFGVSATDSLPKRRDLQRQIYGVDRESIAGVGVAGGRDIRPEPRGLEEVLETLRGERDRRGPLNPDRTFRGFGAAVNQGIMSEPGAAIDLLQAYHTPLEEVKIAKAVSVPGFDPAKQPAGYAEKFPGKKNPYRFAEWETRERAALPDKNDFKDLIDFHRIVASLGQYGEINRLCGLVLDLEFDRPAQSNTPISLQLKTNWQSVQAPGAVQTEPDVAPKIAVVNSKQDFHAAKQINASPIVNRFLRLADNAFSLVQMDVDGAGMKLKNLRESLKQDLPREYDDESFAPEDQKEAEAGLPSLRTGGIMLAQRRRDLSVEMLLQRAEAMQGDLVGGNNEPTLFAEDIVRGFRVDIRDGASKAWRSILFRKIDFDFTNTGGSHVTPKEEGMTRLGGVGSTDNTNTDVLKIHEALVNWSGWSLAAAEPGLLINDDDAVSDQDQETPPGLPLETKYTVVPGTLPRLRFGRNYTMRVRLVDLAGVSVEHSEKDIHPKDAESQTVMLRRHEPIEPPSLALVQSSGVTDPLGDGESMGRVVIRTFNDVPAKNSIVTTEIARRHAVPPRVSHRFAETHGMFDSGPNGALDKTIYPLLIGRDKKLDEVLISRNKPAFDTGPDPEPEKYAVADEDFDLPFLPDPLAVAVAIRVVGAAGVDPKIIHHIPLYCTGASPSCRWPNARPFKIVVIESGAADAKFEAGDREFVIPLAKAERARVYMSFMLPKDSLSMMAVHEMILRRKPENDVHQIIDRLILDGQHWMFTPRRVIEIVHAVQKPLITPVMKNLAIGREFGDTAASPGIESLPFHSKSTGRADMRAEWLEPVDDPTDLNKGQDGPYTVTQKAHAFSRDIARNDAPNGNFNYFSGKQNFVDTRYRRVKYTIDATTRYKEYFPENIRTDENALKVTSPVKVGWVENSSPPPPPNILYVVPTFGWARTPTKDRVSSIRAGGGLRVYLDRPWMTTGFTEMLGIVLPHISANHPVSNADADDDYRKSITMWGADPIWTNPAKIQSAAPPLSAFPLARLTGPITFEGSGFPEEEGIDLPPSFFHQGLPHPESRGANDPQENLRLDVAPHVVGYDADRNLWYSDIVVRPPTGTYFPFIRLALARYNPISVWRAHLSPIVMTEFQQLTPDRLVIVTKDGGSNTAHVAVYGVGGESTLVRIEPDRFEAHTQVLSAGGDVDLDWRTVEAPAPSGPRFTARSARKTITRDQQQASRFRAEAQTLLQADKIQEMALRPELMLALLPPLLWETDIQLPTTPAGGKRRILVTEKEHHRVEFDDLAEKTVFNSPTSLSVAMGSRIVYMETLEI